MKPEPAQAIPMFAIRTGASCDLCAGLPAADFAAEQFVEVQRLDGVVRADAIIRGAGAEPRAGGGLSGIVTAFQISLRDE